MPHPRRSEDTSFTRCARMKVRPPGLGEIVLSPGTPSVVSRPQHFREGWRTACGCDPATWPSRTLLRRHAPSIASPMRRSLVARIEPRSIALGDASGRLQMRSTDRCHQHHSTTRTHASFGFDAHRGCPRAYRASRVSRRDGALPCLESGQPGVLIRGCTPSVPSSAGTIEVTSDVPVASRLEPAAF